MGLSRNKVAVSEGAAGSPPFYGESGEGQVPSRSRRRDKEEEEKSELKREARYCSILRDREILQKGKEKARPDGGVAQLGEHLPCKQGVRGSIPLISTKGGRGTAARTERRRAEGRRACSSVG